jgi:hypothetical protein
VGHIAFTCWGEFRLITDYGSLIILPRGQQVAHPP